MTEDTGEHALAKRDGTDILIVPPVTVPFAGEYQQMPDEAGYVRLSYYEARQLLGRLDSLAGSLLESDRWLADALRRLIDDWGPPPVTATF
ncbi:MAG TPA: hypothetical protein VGF10_11395 [Gaiella sp.]|jgi:hypothetical protein